MCMGQFVTPPPPQYSASSCLSGIKPPPPVSKPTPQSRRGFPSFYLPTQVDGSPPHQATPPSGSATFSDTARLRRLRSCSGELFSEVSEICLCEHVLHMSGHFCTGCHCAYIHPSIHLSNHPYSIPSCNRLTGVWSLFQKQPAQSRKLSWMGHQPIAGMEDTPA